MTLGTMVFGLMVALGLCGLIVVGPAHPAEPLAPALAIVAGLVAVLLGRLVWRAVRHERLHGRLCRLARPKFVLGVAVRELPATRGPFVAGLHRPDIFCGPDLGRLLAPDELRAVLLHERYHQQDRAPAKLVALDAIRPLIGWFGPGRAWLGRQLAALEIAADRHAIRSGSSRSALARALLKLTPASDAVGTGFATAAELRLAALLAQPMVPRRRVPLVWMGVVALVTLGCIVVVIPI
jgi:beta-lactamase regulating signal transducer with metallopeptidase domain